MTDETTRAPRDEQGHLVPGHDVGKATRFAVGNAGGSKTHPPHDPQTRAIAVALSEGLAHHPGAHDTREAGKIIDISDRTIRRWAAGEIKSGPTALEVEAAKLSLADQCAEVARKIAVEIGHYTDMKPANWGDVRNMAVTHGIMVDKAAKLRGEGDTLNIQHTLAGYVSGRMEPPA